MKVVTSPPLARYLRTPQFQKNMWLQYEMTSDWIRNECFTDLTKSTKVLT